MKIILDFDGVGDSKFKKIVLSLIEKLAEFSLREPVIYCTDSHNEVSKITREMSNFIKEKKLVVIKV
jgi:GTP-dependent phosphoenolpyruvate carboxykinase